MADVMGDLKAVRNGQPPLLARQKFNVKSLEELEEGMRIEMSDDDEQQIYSAETIAAYRLWVIILGALSALMALAVLFMLTRT